METKIFDFPYKHFVLDGAIERASWELTLQWLRSTAAWRFHKGDFFTQYEFDVAALADEELMRASGLAMVAKLAGEEICRIYDVVIGGSIRFVAHKLLKGQSIGIHTDLPVRGRENFRVVCTFGEPELVGGQFLLFSGPLKDNLAAVYNPVPGCAVGIPLAPNSYHAVNSVGDGARYSIVVGYKCYALDVLPNDAGLSGVRLRLLLEQLIEMGAEHAKVGTVTLLDHAYEVFRILCRWGAATSLCVSGLLYLLNPLDFSSKADCLLLDEADRALLGQIYRGELDLPKFFSEANDASMFIAAAILVELRVEMPLDWRQSGILNILAVKHPCVHSLVLNEIAL